MRSLSICALSLVPILLPACGQQLVEFPNRGAANSDAGIADNNTDDGEDAEPILDTVASDGPTTDAAGSEDQNNRQ